MRIGLGPLPLELEPGVELEQVYARALEAAELAESVGLDAVWVDSNHFTEEAHGPSPLLAAAAMAARTRRIRIGVATLTLSTGEHPLHVAEEALLVDALSGGRLVLGVGLGYRADELKGFGVEPHERRGRFDEALEMLQGAFADEPHLRLDGEHFRVGSEVVPEPRPVRPGGPPLWVGGGWRPAAVRRVARLGLPLISQFFESPQRIAEKVALYREAAPAGAPGLAIVPAIRDVIVGETQAVLPALVRLYRRYAEWGMPLLERATEPAEIGPDEALRIAIVGSEAEVLERLRELAGAGATDVLARADLPGIPRPRVESTIRALGRIRTELQSAGLGDACQGRGGV